MYKSIEKLSIACCIGLILLLPGCGAQGVQTENRYLSAVWSPDGEQVAYFRRYLEFAMQSKGPGIFIAENSSRRELSVDRLYLCINSKSGKNEQVIAEISYPLRQPDPYSIPDVFTNITWEGNSILYGGAAPDWFSSGVRGYDLVTNEDVLIEPGFDPVVRLGRSPIRKIFNAKQLYSSEDRGYGQINNRVVFLIDHNQKRVSIFVSDPLMPDKPTVPPYSITEP